MRDYCFHHLLSFLKIDVPSESFIEEFSTMSYSQSSHFSSVCWFSISAASGAAQRCEKGPETNQMLCKGRLLLCHQGADESDLTGDQVLVIRIWYPRGYQLVPLGGHIDSEVFSPASVQVGQSSWWEGETVLIKDSFRQEDSSRTATSRTSRSPIATCVCVCVSQTYSMRVLVGPVLTVGQPDDHLPKIPGPVDLFTDESRLWQMWKSLDTVSGVKNVHLLPSRH